VKDLPIGEEVHTIAGQRGRRALAGNSILLVNEKTNLKRTAEDALELNSGEVFLHTATPLVVRTPTREVRASAGRLAVRVDGAGTSVLVASGKATINDFKESLRAGQRLAAGSKLAEPAPRISHPLAWAKDLLADTPLVPASSHAGGDLVARDPDGQEARLALRKYHLDIHIEDGFARTTIDQTFFNHTDSRLEGTFYFPLPPDASLSRLAMYVDGRLNEAGMVERDYGRVVYDRIVYQQKDPALLEWLDGSTFKMRVFPLESRQEKRIVLSYTQKLPVLYSQLSYRFPAGNNRDRVGAFSAHVRIKDGAKLDWKSPSHSFHAAQDGADLVLDFTEKASRANRDVVLTFAEPRAAPVRFSTAEQDGKQYLMVRYRPELAADRAREPRDWTFLFEASGDRDPLLARTQIEIIRGILTEADPRDTFVVLTANIRAALLTAHRLPVTPENVSRAVRSMEKTHLIGALDLETALGHPLEKLVNPWLVHVGSGIAAMGERRDDELVKRISPGTHYVGVGVGKRWNRAFMKLAAEQTGGYFTQINPDEPVSWRAFDLAATLDTPRLLDLKVEDRSGKATFLPFTRIVAQGEELAAVASLKVGDVLPQSLIVSGKVNGEPFERELPVKDVAEKADYLPRTWAKLEIERLLAQDPAKHKDAIIALSKDMYVMTPFTSLLVLENAEMYQQFKVGRGRKDHWAIYPCPEKIEVVYEPEDGPPGDPKKGIKPSARQVLKTVLTRERPAESSSHMEEVGRGLHPIVTSGSFTPAGFIQAFGPSGKKRIYDAQAQFEPLAVALDGWQRGTSLAPARDHGVEDWAQLPEHAQPWPTVAQAPAVNVNGVVPGTNQPGLLATLSVEKAHVPFGGYNGIPPMAIRSRKSGESSQDHIARLLNSSEDLRQLEYEWKKIKQPKEALVLAALNDTEPVLPEPLQRSSLRELGRDQFRPLVYQRPTFSAEDHHFFDLVAYAPGLNSSAADARAVLEVEAAPDAASKPGVIDEGIRELFARSRKEGWQSFTIPADDNSPAWTITFDANGSYAWQRQLTFGLREQVVCDGATLLHLYPDIGLAARRTVSRAHRIDFARMIPWALPNPQDLAHGADLRLVGSRTVALIPHGVAEAKGADGKALPYLQVQYLFAEAGPLAERQVLQMPAKKVLLRHTYSPKGIVKVFGEDGKETATLTGVLAAAKAPDLAPNLDNLVVLPLPYRTADHVRKALNIDGKSLDSLRFEDGLALLAAEFASGQGDNVAKVFRNCFHNRDQRNIGFYVLLAACGQNLDGEHFDVLSEHPDEPLAQYLALHSSAVLRKHASQWAAASNAWGEGFLHNLALSHALCQRWQKGRPIAGRGPEVERALAFVRAHKASAFAWAVLRLLADRAQDDEAAGKDTTAVHRALAEVWPHFYEVPGLDFAARYEHARSLWKSGRGEEARKCFVDLYSQTIRAGTLPVFDTDLRSVLLSDNKDLWGGLLRQTAANLVKEKKPTAALTMARQCWQVGDRPLAGSLYAMALAGCPAGKDGRALRAAGLAYLWETRQLADADALLQRLQGDASEEERAVLLRLAANIASQRDQPARELEFLERALDAEFTRLPDVIDLQSVRSEYERLLKHYQTQAEALVSLGLAVPPGFRDKVIRVADRWRALDAESAPACRLAARVLQTLGQRELTWDYLTTPVALQPNESGPWSELGQTLARQGDWVLADKAFSAAYAAEPTNPQLLWDRAQNLGQAGQVAEAQKLYRKLAAGPWPQRFSWLQSQARWQLEKP
jgi:hypothetical protein